MNNGVVNYVVYFHDTLFNFCISRTSDDYYFNYQLNQWEYCAGNCWSKSLATILNRLCEEIGEFSFNFSDYVYTVNE